MSNYLKNPSISAPLVHPVATGLWGSTSGGTSTGSSSGSSGYSGGFKGANNDRQRRYEYNAMKRGGDWFAINTLPMLLWVDEALCYEDDPECPLPDIDLWP